jgi:hypothetical protein
MRPTTKTIRISLFIGALLEGFESLPDPPQPEQRASIGSGS